MFRSIKSFGAYYYAKGHLPDNIQTDRMKCLLFALAFLAVSQAALVLSPELHMDTQEMCANLHHPDFLKDIDAGEKSKVLPHIATVCEIFANRFINPSLLEKRELLDSLAGLLGNSNPQLASLLKAANALNKAKNVFDELKQVAPAIHDHLNGGIQDVHDEFQSLIDDITNMALGTPTTAKPAY